MKMMKKITLRDFDSHPAFGLFLFAFAIWTITITNTKADSSTLFIAVNVVAALNGILIFGASMYYRKKRRGKQNDQRKTNIQAIRV